MLDPRIRDAIIPRLEDEHSGVRCQAIRTLAEHVDGDDAILSALIVVASGEPETDPETRHAAFKAVSGLFSSHDRATQAVEQALSSNLETIRSEAAGLVVRLARSGDHAATRMLVRSLGNHTEEVQTLFVSAARDLIDEGRVEDLNEQLLLQLESADAADRILAVDLLGLAGAVHGDLATQDRGSLSRRSGGNLDADANVDSGVPVPESRLAEELIAAMRRAEEEASGEADHTVHGAGGDAGHDGSLAVGGADRDEAPPDLTQYANPRSAINLLEELLSIFDERELVVLEQRSVTLEEPTTLAELGTALDVTRERIRQIEGRAKSKWRGLVSKPTHRPIRVLAEGLSAELGSAVPASEEVVSDAADRFCGGLAPQLRTVALGILLELGGYCRRERWLVGLSQIQQDNLTTGIGELVDQWPVVPRAQLSSLLGRYQIAVQHMEGWCTTFERLRFIASGALPKKRTLDDVERVLLRRGEPASVRQLLAEAERTDKNERGIRHQMSKDERFTRIDRDGQFAHRDWGFKEYTRIADGIVEELQRRGGTVPIDHLCSVLSQRLDVAESSVRVYAAAPIFMKTASGALTLRPAGVPFEFDEDLAASPACFWHEDHWSLRMPVTLDLLRGSGRSIPMQFAAYLGCRPGLNKDFATAWGEVKAVWATTTPGPSLGSVRPVLTAVDAEEGDLLFVCYRPGSADIDLRVVKRTLPGSSPVEQRIADELGLHKEIGSLNDVADALRVEHDGGLESPVWREVQKALQARAALDLGGLLDEYVAQLAEPAVAADVRDDSVGH